MRRVEKRPGPTDLGKPTRTASYNGRNFYERTTKKKVKGGPRDMFRLADGRTKRRINYVGGVPGGNIFRFGNGRNGGQRFVSARRAAVITKGVNLRDNKRNESRNIGRRPSVSSVIRFIYRRCRPAPFLYDLPIAEKRHRAHLT